MQRTSALPETAAETYTAQSTAAPAVQSNEVYPTPCTAVPSISFGSASDKRYSLAVITTRLCPTALLNSGITPHPYRDFEHAGWECVANAYAATFESATRPYGEVLLDAAGLKPGDEHLDIACGTGYVTALGHERGANSIGTDFSAAMLAEALRLHPLLRFEPADAEALPYSDGSFDVVTINFGVHHFPFPERALAETRRVLRKGGRVSFSVWATPDEHALHAIALEAVRGAGSAGATLPAPPHGGLNTLAGCTALLVAAHFKPVPEHCTLVRRILHLGSVAELTHLIESGTVRLASLLRSQPQANRQAILHGLEDAAARYQREERLEIPVVAVVATGIAE